MNYLKHPIISKTPCLVIIVKVSEERKTLATSPLICVEKGLICVYDLSDNFSKLVVTKLFRKGY